MKRAIAMRCNQKQFDAIKGKLVRLNVCNIPGFDYNNYLTNNWADTSFDHSDSAKCEIHETWNEQIFLEACGIETEKIFKGSELQFWSSFLNEWVGLDTANFATKYRLKPDNSKEIAELERQIEILKNK